MSKNARVRTAMPSSISTTMRDAPTIRPQSANSGSTSAPTAAVSGKVNAPSSKSTQSSESLPDVCRKCHGAHGPAMYRIRVNVYRLEDLPIRAYYFELCEPCFRKMQRSSKRSKVSVVDCAFDAV